jgi:hypothetical protein
VNSALSTTSWWISLANRGRRPGEGLDGGPQEGPSRRLARAAG